MEQNPKTERTWRYTWEAQSHSPNLRLFLFDSITNPKVHCKSLKVSIVLGKSQLLVTWIDNEDEEATRSEEIVSLRVPVPRVLLDVDSPVTFRALDDHIEVRLVLLLPVDHPLVSDFNLVTYSREDRSPLVLDYDLKSLSSMGGVHFYCRNCSTSLTKREVFDFSEMPSVNWRESADNWFGTCCCSFGGISEKMVAKYTNSYTCTSGLCLLSPTTVLLNKDDLIECFFPDKIEIQNQFESSLALSCDHTGVESGSRSRQGNVESHENGVETACEGDAESHENEVETACEGDAESHDNGAETACEGYTESHENGAENACEGNTESHENGVKNACEGNTESHENGVRNACEGNTESHENGVRNACEGNTESHENGVKTACEVYDLMLHTMPVCCAHDSSGSNESLHLEQKLTLDKQFLIDGFLEDVFMAKASNVSKNVDWIEFACPECSSPVGAFPSCGGNNDKSIDGGVRLFKCYISTSSATGESSNVFRKYTLERMFTNQLVECAKEELSFHVLVKELTTKSSLFQIVILNPNSWSSTGLCSNRDEPISTLELCPIVKVLFSDCNSSVVKKIDEEVYILKGQGEELIELLTNASKFLPSSCSYLQGSPVSSIHL